MEGLFKKTVENGIEMLSFSPALSTKIRVTYVIEDGKFIHKKVWPHGGVQETVVIKEIQSVEKGKWNFKSLNGIRTLIVKTSTTNMELESISNPDKIRSYILGLKTAKENVEPNKDTEGELAPKYVYVPAIPDVIYNLLKSIQTGGRDKLISWEVTTGEFVKANQVIGQLNVPVKKYKYDDIRYKNIAIIRAPISGKIIEITSDESTSIFETRLPTDSLQKYRFFKHMLIIQPLASEKFAGNPFTKPLADYCFFKFADRNSSYFEPLEALYKIVNRSEPVTIKEDWKVTLSDDDDLEEFAVQIPYPSYYLCEALFGNFGTSYSVKRQSRVNQGDSIGEFNSYGKAIASIISPVDGLILFTGLDYSDSEVMKIDRSYKTEFLQGTIWGDDNWPIKEFYNEEYNRVKTILCIIQPRRGSDITKYVRESYKHVIPAIEERLSEKLRDDFSYSKEKYKTVVEKEILKIKESDGRLIRRN